MSAGGVSNCRNKTRAAQATATHAHRVGLPGLDFCVYDADLVTFRFGPGPTFRLVTKLEVDPISGRVEVPKEHLGAVFLLLSSCVPIPDTTCLAWRFR